MNRIKARAILVIITSVLTLVIILLSSASCTLATPTSDDEESPLVELKHWQIGEWWQYSPRAIWGDIFIGLESIFDGGLKEQYISAYNLRTRESERVLEIDPDNVQVGAPSIYENMVVWSAADISEEQQDELDWNVLLLDLDTGEVQQITDDQHAQTEPRICGNTIVWLDNRHGTGERYPYPQPLDVYAYDLSTGEEKRITAATTAEGYGHPAASGSIVVWTDSRHVDPEVIRHASNEPDYNNEIYMYDLTTGEERRVTDYPGNDRCPAIDGNRIVWLRQSDYRKADVFVYDIKTCQETQVSHSSYAAFHPAIYGDHIVWTDARVSKGNTTNDVVEIVADPDTGAEERREPGADIYLYDLKAQQEVRLTLLSAEGFSLWVRPCIHSEFIVYMLDRQVNPITYAMRLER
jgi:beta propeller repeat protein